jgi:hypothetical protein
VIGYQKSEQLDAKPAESPSLGQLKRPFFSRLAQIQSLQHGLRATRLQPEPFFSFISV